ncbi:NSS family neurotransmitter:Na+ symporter [Melghiribacillus thermohalophilus]|uniref:Transporter n=1 Tax=Melghiribacillus thermohalophilus TaxID=1324956 RepID=A0A4R3MUS9_9BACI|nr:sodium-dependent transporter [Melghiribacillus thermohalophilus]TCT19091.1 NSS family neurotransmitter:Na+ symporter [Melghiribacillus thermohalophilus]
MDNNRPQWGTRAGFILAAVGSAVGLGNIWRFPYTAFENGGGAFLIPYFFALITAGIPILILEFHLGHKLRGSAPLSFSKLGRLEWLGWWQTFISFVISIYYSAIIGWAFAYTFFAVGQSWGEDTGAFLYKYLGITQGDTTYGFNDFPSFLGGMQWKVLIPMLIVWVIVYIILSRGVQKGIEKANKFFMPLLFILIILIAIRGITLEGATAGLNALFQPDWSGIANAQTWIAAYGQVFFSLSIAFAIMITYSSYLPKKSDINNNAFITAFANSGVSIIAGVAVFSAIGFMAAQSGSEVGEVATGGVGLAFAVFPTILNEMPMGEVVGILFFLSLIVAGLSSLISIVETFIAAFSDKFNIERKKSVNISVGLITLLSLFFATGAGLYLLDTVDYFINSYGVAMSGLIMAIVVGWVLNYTNKVREYNNQISDIRIGGWWNFFVIVLTPSVLGYMAIKQIATDLAENYGGYPDNLIGLGWAVAVLAFVFGFYFQSLRSKNPEFNTPVKEDESA